MCIVNSEIVDSIVEELEIEDIRSASIRQIGAVVRAVEARTGVEFIHFEMGVPGLPPSAVGVKAECEALQRGVASVYPIIDGIPEIKEQASRFVKAFLDTDIKPQGCIPTVGSMQASFASLMIASQFDRKRNTVLYIDPGFPVQKLQAQVIGVDVASFDIASCRGKSLEAQLKSMYEKGNICAVLYSTPNNPTWMTYDVLKTRIKASLPPLANS